MTTTPLPRLPMTKAIKALFVAQFHPKPIGLAVAPRMADPEDPSTLIAVPPPYGVLHALWTTTGGPPLHDPNADSEWNYQLSLYAEKGDQLEWMLDKARAVWVGRNPDRSWRHPIEVEGMKVMDRELRDDLGADPSGASIDAVLRLAIKVTPDYV